MDTVGKRLLAYWYLKMNAFAEAIDEKRGCRRQQHVRIARRTETAKDPLRLRVRFKKKSLRDLRQS
jgi:hypothetical protein